MKRKGLYVKNYINYSDILLNKSKTAEFYDQQIVKTAKDQIS